MKSQSPVRSRATTVLATCLALGIFGADAAAEVAQVGLAAVDIKPAIGIPLAGYGAKSRRVPGYIDWRDKYPGAFYFRPSEGRHTPIRSKVMVIRNGDDQLVFVSVDFVGVEYAMIKDLADRLAHLGVTEDNLIVSGTHTHHGPGSTTRRFALAVAAVDKFNRDNYESIMVRVQESIEFAFANLAPAELLQTSFETDGIQRNKFRRIGEGHFDSTARLLLARSTQTGSIVGGLVHYPLHGNGMPVDDLRFSSDVLGQIEIRMEKLIDRHNGAVADRSVVLFMNGAQGDVGNPKRSEGGSNLRWPAFCDASCRITDIRSPRAGRSPAQRATLQDLAGRTELFAQDLARAMNPSSPGTGSASRSRCSFCTRRRPTSAPFRSVTSGW